MGYYVTVRLRNLFSTALVLPVLIMSGWAPACDLSCSFEGLQGMGHRTVCLAHGAASLAGGERSAEAAATTMNDMVMPTDSQSMALATNSPVATVATASLCSHEKCSQPAISVAAKRNLDCSPLEMASVLASPAANFAPSFSTIQANCSVETPPKIVPLDPLVTALRI
jgi:hypothetical protein